jgi:hypothetical protein
MRINWVFREAIGGIRLIGVFREAIGRVGV